MTDRDLDLEFPNMEFESFFRNAEKAFDNFHRVEVSYTKLDNYAGPDILVPAKENDVGIDLYAAEDITIPPGQRAVVPVGLKIAVPPGMEAQIRPKSGRAANEGLTVLNTPGTIDPGYRGELGVILYNSNVGNTLSNLVTLISSLKSFVSTSSHENRDGSFSINTGFDPQKLNDERMITNFLSDVIRIDKGQKIAQLVFAEYIRPELDEVEEKDLPSSDRGEGGFGSSGL